ncbi:unnamed protein product [Prorocentrum cordatum]|uniref:Uncharacterized protein n=1 Tax=Prorocentrum cordatum TaxID=2364126 RepID=A0ABN9TW64_9DINO|nr:unnamed protein product [Polarella glacialis]
MLRSAAVLLRLVIVCSGDAMTERFVVPVVYPDDVVGGHCVQLIDLGNGAWVGNRSFCTGELSDVDQFVGPLSCTFDGRDTMVVMDKTNTWYAINLTSMSLAATRQPDGHDWVFLTLSDHGTMLGVFHDQEDQHYAASVGAVWDSEALPVVWQSVWGQERHALDYGIATSTSSDALLVPTQSGGGKCGSLYTLRLHSEPDHLELGSEDCVIPLLRYSSSGSLLALSLQDGSVCEHCPPRLSIVEKSAGHGDGFTAPSVQYQRCRRMVVEWAARQSWGDWAG